jgi:hypothetical protein
MTPSATRLKPCLSTAGQKRLVHLQAQTIHLCFCLESTKWPSFHKWQGKQKSAKSTSSGKSQTTFVSSQTLFLQHLIRVSDLDVFWEPHGPTEEDLNDSSLHFLCGPSTQILKVKTKSEQVQRT